MLKIWDVVQLVVLNKRNEETESENKADECADDAESDKRLEVRRQCITDQGETVIQGMTEKRANHIKRRHSA